VDTTVRGIPVTLIVFSSVWLPSSTTETVPFGDVAQSGVQSPWLAVYARLPSANTVTLAGYGVAVCPTGTV